MKNLSSAATTAEFASNQQVTVARGCAFAGRAPAVICMNANISRQFEFLQNAWINSTKFSGLTGESDPLLGNRVVIRGCSVTGDFTIQNSDGLRRRISGTPQFIKVRGGAYFFMPGIRALRYFGQLGSSPNTRFSNQRNSSDWLQAFD
jgi:hypothetical protein